MYETLRCNLAESTEQKIKHGLEDENFKGDRWQDESEVSKLVSTSFNPTASIDDQLLKDWLLSLGFRLDSPKKNAFTKIKKMLVRSRPNIEEWGVFAKALRQNQRRLQDRS